MIDAVCAAARAGLCRDHAGCLGRHHSVADRSADRRNHGVDVDHRRAPSKPSISATPITTRQTVIVADKSMDISGHTGIAGGQDRRHSGLYHPGQAYANEYFTGMRLKFASIRPRTRPTRIWLRAALTPPSRRQYRNGGFCQQAMPGPAAKSKGPVANDESILGRGVGAGRAQR